MEGDVICDVHRCRERLMMMHEAERRTRTKTRRRVWALVDRGFMRHSNFF